MLRSEASLQVRYRPRNTIRIIGICETHGAGATQQDFTAYFRAFAEPDPKITLVFATAEHAAAEWTFKGQYTGQLPGLPPGEAQPVSVRGANIMTLREGAIVEERIYTDLAGLLGQLGLGAAAPGTPTSATPAG